MRWGNDHRPVARFIPRFIVDRFDRVADWLDAEVMTVRGYKIERWDVLSVIVMFAVSAIYSIYMGSWLYGMTLGPLIFVLGWMAFKWFI